MYIAPETIRKKSLELLKHTKKQASVYQNRKGCVNLVEENP